MTRGPRTDSPPSIAKRRAGVPGEEFLPARLASLSDRWRAAVLALAIVVAGFAAYAPALGAGFVWDDHSVVEHSTLLRGPLSDLWFGTAQKDYWPLTYTALWLQWRAWGGDPTGYHVVNVVLHLAAAILLWQVLRSLRMPGAWLAGLLFAIHPVGVESAAWISEQKNTLSAVLFLAAVWAWLRHLASGRTAPYVAALVAFAAALLAKTSVVMGPFVLLALRLRATGRRPTSRDAFSVAPFFAASLAAGVATLWFQHHHAMAGAGASQRGVLERLGAAGWALAAYVQHAFLPVGVSTIYAEWPVDPGSPAFYAPAAAALGVALLLWRGRTGPAAALIPALGYHALMLVPVLGFVEIAYFAVGPISNHLQYLSLMGPVALVAYGVARLAQRAPASGIAVPLALVIAFGVGTFRRARAFDSDLTLWREAVRTAPRSSGAHYQLASMLAAEDRMPEAIREYARAEETSRSEDGRLVARAYGALYARALPQAEAAARALLASGDADMRRDGALVLAAVGHRDAAIETFRELARQNPASSDYAYWLGALLAQAGRIAEASAALGEWCTRRPGHPRLEEAYAFTLVRLGAIDEARRRAAAVLSVDESHPDAAAKLEQWMSQPGWRPQRSR